MNQQHHQHHQQSRTQQDPGEQIHVHEIGSGLQQRREHMTSSQQPSPSRSARKVQKIQAIESIRERRRKMTLATPGDQKSGNGQGKDPPGSPGKKQGNGGVESSLSGSDSGSSAGSGTGAGKLKRVLCRFGHNHVQMEEWAQDFILDNRDLVGIDRHWSIHVEVADPDTIFQHAEGLISYDEEAYYALVTVRCDLPYNLLEWIVVHELFELKRYKSASAIQDWYHFQLREYDSEPVRRQQVERFYRQIMKARNQEIEQEVYQYLGHHRPMHMPVTGQPGSSPPLPSVLSSPSSSSPDQRELDQDDDEEEEQNE